MQKSERTNARHRTIYEQAPYDPAHIAAIYRNLAGRIIADGEWHDFPPVPVDIGRYRVFEEKYFQAVYARSANPVFKKLTAMPAVEREDDAEWTLWREPGSFAITSDFAVTPHLNGYGPVGKWLERHDLGWERHPHGLQGVAFFADLEPGCLADAMDRLVWFENEILALNSRLDQAAINFWNAAKQENDRVVANLPSDYPAEEIIPIPMEQPRSSWKRRVALT